MILFVTLTILIATPTSLYALDFVTIKMYAKNNIVYYDPTPHRTCSSALNCNISGETRDERLWSGLRNLGFTPAQTAALMGNILHEGGSPTTQETSYVKARNNNCMTQEGTPYTIWGDATPEGGGQHHGSCIGSPYSAGKEVVGIGLGFIQWTSRTRRIGYLDLMKDAGLIDYFDGDAYKEWGSLSDDALHEKIIAEKGDDADYWALWCTALKYIYYELSSNGNWSKFFSYDDPEEGAGFIASSYEVCGNCSSGGSQWTARRATAREIYDRYEAGDFASVENGSGDEVSGGSSTSGSAAGASLDTCAYGGLVSDPDEAISYLQQFILDTNAEYGTDYDMPSPNPAPFNQGLGTPGSHSQSPCWGASDCGQCTALSGWFVTKMTNLTYGGGNGGEVVRNLVSRNGGSAYYFANDGGPNGVAIFSVSSSSIYGHTGVILGKADDGDYITIENNIPSAEVSIRKRSLSYFTNGSGSYYPVGSINVDHLGTTY